MKSVTVVKIGGNVIDDPAALKRFLGEFARSKVPRYSSTAAGSSPRGLPSGSS